MTRRIIICEIAVLCFFVIFFAQIHGDACPRVETVKDFNLTRLIGRWYVHKSLFSRYQKVPDCETFDFAISGNGTAVVRHNVFGKMDVVGDDGFSKTRGKWLTSNFSLRTPDASKPGKLRGNFWAGDEDFDVFVLKTDNSSYLVLHLCIEYDEGNSQFTFILSRDIYLLMGGPQRSAMAEVGRRIAAEGVSKRHETYIQSRCIYEPSPL